MNEILHAAAEPSVLTVDDVIDGRPVRPVQTTTILSCRLVPRRDGLDT